MQESQKKLFYAISVVLLVIVVGAAFFHSYENWDWLDSFYFAVTTISTVGYGDLHPTRPETKLFIMGYIIFGVAMMFYALTAFGHYWVEMREKSFDETITRLKTFNTAAIRKLKDKTAF